MRRERVPNGPSSVPATMRPERSASRAVTRSILSPKRSGWCRRISVTRSASRKYKWVMLNSCLSCLNSGPYFAWIRPRSCDASVGRSAGSCSSISSTARSLPARNATISRRDACIVTSSWSKALARWTRSMRWSETAKATTSRANAKPSGSMTRRLRFQPALDRRASADRLGPVSIRRFYPPNPDLRECQSASRFNS